MPRTSTVKHLDEKNVYMLPESGQEYLKYLGTLKITGTTSLEVVEGEAFTTGHDVVVNVIYVPEGGIASDMEITISSETATVLAGAAADLGYRLGTAQITSALDITTASVTSGTPGVILEVYEIPNYTTSDQIGYTDNLSYTNPMDKRRVKDQGETEHFKRVKTRERTTDMTVKFQSYGHGASQHVNNPTTVVTEVEDDGAGTISERILLGELVYPNPGPSGSSGDTDDTFNVSGEFTRMTVIDF